MSKLIHEELSREIIGVAMHVLNEMKLGLDEKLYERTMMIELRRRGHTVDQKVIVDPKVVAAFNEAHVAQMIGYLTITGLQLVLLLGFKSARVRTEGCCATARRRILSSGSP
jgi:PD-(D/E)XK nuclease superfamily